MPTGCQSVSPGSVSRGKIHLVARKARSRQPCPARPPGRSTARSATRLDDRGLDDGRRGLGRPGVGAASVGGVGVSTGSTSGRRRGRRLRRRQFGRRRLGRRLRSASALAPPARHTPGPTPRPGSPSASRRNRPPAARVKSVTPCMAAAPAMSQSLSRPSNSRPCGSFGIDRMRTRDHAPADRVRPDAVLQPPHQRLGHAHPAVDRKHVRVHRPACRRTEFQLGLERERGLAAAPAPGSRAPRPRPGTWPGRSSRRVPRPGPPA